MDGGVNLANKMASNVVQKREQGEGREIGCKGTVGIVGVGREPHILPAATAERRSCNWAARRRGARVSGVEEKRGARAFEGHGRRGG